MTRDRRELSAVFAGGFVGAILRAQLADAVAHDPGGSAWATLLANLGGAFLLGYAATLLRERGRAAVLRLRLLASGFCGALTTFSTLQLELLVMLEAGEDALAVTYMAVSVSAGLAAVVAGSALAGRRRRTGA